MKWLIIFVLFSDGSTDYKVYDLVASGTGCEAAKEAIGKGIKYGEADGKIVVQAHMECFDTKPVERE